MITAITAKLRTRDRIETQADLFENICVEAINTAIYKGNYSCYVNTSNYLRSSIEEVIEKLKYFGYDVRDKCNLLYIYWDDPQ